MGLSLHEIVTLALAIVTPLLGALSGVLLWLAKILYEDVRELRTKVTRLESAAETHHEHGVRLVAVEAKLGELAANLVYVVEWVKRQEDRRSS